MANKLTIDQINARLDELHRRLSRTVKAIDQLRALRSRIRNGKVKQPPPPLKKVMLKTLEKWEGEALDDGDGDRVDDLYAVAPGGTSPC